ncbi:MAG: RpiB/LacA/LacB family sugar-phosphate isomerase [Anaerolineae bacterium]|jgi:ribose 5-phosphate isomerase B|nr:RpiB/LacA/LacB family sugar-phosphate isomerase [Anaerolineae bacterium]
MKLVIAADHAGFDLKQHLIGYLRAAGHDVLDLGVESAATRSDYPEIARRVGTAVVAGAGERGILICGSGVGASIAANKIKGVYAAICHDVYSAAQGVQHDNMNVLCLGGKVIGSITAETLVTAFVGASFNTTTERYLRRFQQMQAIENGD